MYKLQVLIFPNVSMNKKQKQSFKFERRELRKKVYHPSRTPYTTNTKQTLIILFVVAMSSKARFCKNCRVLGNKTSSGGVLRIPVSTLQNSTVLLY